MIMINGWGNFMIMINDWIIVDSIQVSHEDKCCVPHAVSEHCSCGVRVEGNINPFTAKNFVWHMTSFNCEAPRISESAL